MSIPPKWEKQTFLGEVSFQLFFPLNSFPSANFPLVCRVCSQTKLFSSKYFSIFPLHVPHFLQKLEITHFLACFGVREIIFGFALNVFNIMLHINSGCYERQGYVGVRRSLVSNQSPLRTEPHAAMLGCVGEMALC